MASESAAPEMAEYLKLICKIFWSTTYMGIPDTLLQPPQFLGWMEAIRALLLRPVPLVGPGVGSGRVWATKCLMGGGVCGWWW